VYRLDPVHLFIQLPPEAISALYHSVNSVSVLLPGEASAIATAVIIGYRMEPKRFGVVIALHLVEARRHLIYTHDDDGLDHDGARAAAQEAIAFTESMGFFMENAGWKDLDPVQQRERLAGVRVFQPPEVTAQAAQASKIVDPRTKLARLFVQF